MTNDHADNTTPLPAPDMLALLAQRREASADLVDVDVVDHAIDELVAFRDALVAEDRAELEACRADNRTRKAAGVDVSAGGALARLLAESEDHAAVSHSA